MSVEQLFILHAVMAAAGIVLAIVLSSRGAIGKKGVESLVGISVMGPWPWMLLGMMYFLCFGPMIVIDRLIEWISEPDEWQNGFWAIVLLLLWLIIAYFLMLSK